MVTAMHSTWHLKRRLLCVRLDSTFEPVRATLEALPQTKLERGDATRARAL